MTSLTPTIICTYVVSSLAVSSLAVSSLAVSMLAVSSLAVLSLFCVSSISVKGEVLFGGAVGWWEEEMASVWDTGCREGEWKYTMEKQR